MPKAPFVANRKELKTIFISALENSQDEDELDHKKKLKSYLIESNIKGADSTNIKGPFDIENTSDPTLKIIKVKTSEKTILNFYLDIEDSRFWKIHSLYDSNVTEQYIKRLVEQNNSKLDYLWICSSLLEKYMDYGKNTGFGIKFKNKFLNEKNNEQMSDVSMRFWGDSAKSVIGDLRKNNTLIKGVNLSAIGLNHEVEGGYAKENITNFARFTVMKGNSIDSHFNILQKIKSNYSEKLKLIEDKYRVLYKNNSTGIKLSGSPIYIDFTKPIEDVGKLVDIMVSSTNPFRLSGVKRMVDNKFVRVFGIDLHTNDLINMEVTPNWISLYLNSNSCGNVVTRLLTNIQSHITSQIKLVGGDNERII